MDQYPNQLPPLGGPNGPNGENVEPIGQQPYPYYYQEPKKKLGFAITSLVLGIVSIIGLCCCIGIFTAPVAVIFGIIALAKKHDGKGMSITGIILGGLTIILTAAALISLRPLLSNIETISEDVVKLVEQQDEVFPAYEQDSKNLPDYMKKYLEPPFSDILEKYDLTVYDVMDALLTQYKSGKLPRTDSMGSRPAVSSLPDSQTESSTENSSSVPEILSGAGQMIWEMI